MCFPQAVKLYLQRRQPLELCIVSRTMHTCRVKYSPNLIQQDHYPRTGTPLQKLKSFMTDQKSCLQPLTTDFEIQMSWAMKKLYEWFSLTYCKTHPLFTLCDSCDIRCITHNVIAFLMCYCVVLAHHLIGVTISFLHEEPVAADL